MLTNEAHHGRHCMRDSLLRGLSDALPSSAHPIPSKSDGFVKAQYLRLRAISQNFTYAKYSAASKSGNKKNRTEKDSPPGRTSMASELSLEGLIVAPAGILRLFESAVILLHGFFTRRFAAYDETCHHHNGQCKKKQSFHGILLIKVVLNGFKEIRILCVGVFFVTVQYCTSRANQPGRGRAMLIYIFISVY